MFSRIRKFLSEYNRIKYLAYHDMLTGLLNRNWLYENKTKISTKYVYFIDINDLKDYNDSRGHTYGDLHIVNVVTSIKMRISNNKDNILIRYAGDEFILFSNIKNLITGNTLYSVGSSMIFNKDIEHSIRIADNEMIKSKKLYKKNGN